MGSSCSVAAIGTGVSAVSQISWNAAVPTSMVFGAGASESTTDLPEASWPVTILRGWLMARTSKHSGARRRSGHALGPRQREQLAVGAGLLDHARDRRSRQHPVEVGGQRRDGVAVERMEDVGVVQGGRRGAVGQREVLAGQPAVVAASLSWRSRVA